MVNKKRIWQDSETEIDFLNFGYLVDLVVDLATNRDLSPSTIGIYGDWGSGKSSLMRMAQNKIELSDDKKVICVRFNGWLFEGYEDAKTSLCGVILDEIRNSSKVLPAIKAKATKLLKKIDVNKLLGKGIKLTLDGILTGGIGTLSALTIKSIMNSLRESAGSITAEQVEELLNKFRADENTREEIKSFQNEFAKLIEDSRIDQLVVFIDELDRCTPDTILEVFEAMRLFLFAKGTSFIIGADERLIQYAIKTKYKEVLGNNLDIGKEYLEKVIQYPVNIPNLTPSEVEQYIACLLLVPPTIEQQVFDEFLQAVHSLGPDQELSLSFLQEKHPSIVNDCHTEVTLAKQFSSVLAFSINGNPRQCKRFLNTVFMRKQLAKSRGVSLEEGILAKLLLAEYFKPAFYNLLVDASNESELKKFEAGKVEAGSPFHKWLEDKWVSSWNQIPVKLSGKKLSDYHYFSKSRFKTEDSLENLLSSLSRRVYLQLLSRTESGRIVAEEQFPNIQKPEKAIIASLMFRQLIAESELDSDLFTSFICIGKQSDIKDDTLLQLLSVPAVRYSPGLVGQLSGFMSVLSTEQCSKLHTHLSENPSLKTALEVVSRVTNKS